MSPRNSVPPPCPSDRRDARVYLRSPAESPAPSCPQSRPRPGGSWASQKAAKSPAQPAPRPKPQFCEGFPSNAILTQSPSAGKRPFRIQDTMSSEAHNPSPSGTLVAPPTARSVTPIVPARNEEAGIAASIASLALQPEIPAIRVVTDRSTDGTASVVRSL